MYSNYLTLKKDKLKHIVQILSNHFSYVSVLATDCKATNYLVTKNITQITDGRNKERGFVIKMNNNGVFFEYASDDLSKSAEEIAQDAILSAKTKEKNVIKLTDDKQEVYAEDFRRENDFALYTSEEIISSLSKIKDEIIKDDRVLNASCSLSLRDESKVFISNTKELTQNYTWVNGSLRINYYANDKKIVATENSFSSKIKDVLDELPTRIETLLDKAYHLTLAKPMVPGYYDIITDASISGLIAHEAFGHGVEMDQFVKDRALAKKFINDYVASPIVNMRDGAASCLSAASYFFDDDGILAQDTQIIKNGILVSGISDLTSSRELGTKPTGNSRRQNFAHKAYTRMTNTFFDKGQDKLEDMIKSIKHGFFLYETNNGMEDPKNWAIQCVANYAREIIDGKLTDNYYSPVVMSGYVPDLLKSISMVSDSLEIEGAGGCGKGYKEWVSVSTGGPNLKAKVKLS